MSSWIEQLFKDEWKVLAPDIEWQEEYSDIEGWEACYQSRKASNPRSKRWRADFALPAIRLLVECQGGVWRKECSHTRGAGIEHDYRKQLLATLSGWQVIHVTGNMVNKCDGWMPDLVRYVRQRLTETAEGSGGAGYLSCPESHTDTDLLSDEAHQRIG